MDIESGRSRLLPVATDIIRRRARSLVGQHGFTPSDVADIEQDLIFEILQRSAHFDPSRGSEVQFAVTVIKHGIATAVERRHAAKRGVGTRHMSLDEELDPTANDSSTRYDIIDAESYLALTRGPDTPDARRQDLRMDLNRALSALPPDLRELAENLKEHTASELARSSGVPRTTINERIKKLRAALRKRGLAEY